MYVTLYLPDISLFISLHIIDPELWVVYVGPLHTSTFLLNYLAKQVMQQLKDEVTYTYRTLELLFNSKWYSISMQ